MYPGNLEVKWFAQGVPVQRRHSFAVWPEVTSPKGPVPRWLCDNAQEKVDARRVRLGAGAALVIEGAGVRIAGLDLEGTLVVDARPGAAVTIDGAHVRNAGWRWQALKPEKPMTEEQYIR